MKNYSILSLSMLLFVCSLSKGQEIYNAPLEEKKQLAFVPNIFIGPSVGKNNIAGIIGILAEVHVYKKVTLVGAAGLDVWGGTLSAQARYYRRYPVGVFYGVGFSTFTGVNGYKRDLEVENQEDMVEVEMDLKKVNCINICIGQHFKLGKRMRLNFLLGYAIPMQTDFYEIKTPNIVLTSSSEDAMDLLTPGGLILGAAFSIGI
jgi:hypothetical protein